MGIGGGSVNTWMEARRIIGMEGPRIVTVGLIYGTKILTGKRRDNQLWTNPGGHMDDGETLVEAACREVLEESGIALEPKDLELVSAERVTSNRTGKPFSVFAFIAEVAKEKATSKDDPDQEVSTWKWVELSHDTPELHPKNRHAQHDSVLCHLGYCLAHARLKGKDFTSRRLAMTSDEYTEGIGSPKREIVTNPDSEGQAIYNIGK